MILFHPQCGTWKKSKNMPSENNLKYWQALIKISELGPARIKNLYEQFKEPKKIWEASRDDLIGIAKIGQFLADKIIYSREKIGINNADEIDPSIKTITLSDPSYPKNLYNIYDPPPILYVKGSILPQDSLSIAVVGTRRSSYYGENITKKLAKDLVNAGFTIVSGLAQGIDSISHISALEAKGRTFAVLGSGLNTIYPSNNKILSENIINNGALISEFPPNYPIEKWNFPRRNRIISGLSKGVLVVEGSIKSGALITAKYGLEQNREIFAIPGPVDRELSQGPNSLIKQGAKLVESADDILEELNIYFDKDNVLQPNFDISKFSNDEQLILKIILDQPEYIDNISQKINFPHSKTSSLISSLMLGGSIKELPGKYFVACID